MSLGTVDYSSLAAIDVVSSKWDFQAFNENQLTIKRDEKLLLLSEKQKDEWAAVRTLAHPITGRPSSGLVPKSYLRSKTPRYRGYALYKYNPDNFRFIQMYLGQELGVYKVYGPWALVKLDGSGGQIGFVPEGYIKSVEGTGKDDLGPSSLKQLPERHCVICEESLVSALNFECTRCRLPNGDPFLICRRCAYVRQACFAHQGIKGQDHLFDLREAPRTVRTCDECGAGVSGTKFFCCLACRYLTSGSFDLCTRCHSDPMKPSHDHPMILVSEKGRLTEPHSVGLREVTVPRGHYACNGCYRRVTGYVLHCRVCPAEGFDVCLDCAEIDRATYLHDRWTPGAPHDFEIKRSS